MDNGKLLSILHRRIIEEMEKKKKQNVLVENISIICPNFATGKEMKKDNNELGLHDLIKR